MGRVSTVISRTEITDRAKLDSSKLQEQTWFEYQLLQLVLSIRFQNPFEKELLIRGPLVYMSDRNLDKAFWHPHRGHSEMPYNLFLDPFSQSPTWVINRFMPYVFIALHKVLDTICGWVISSNGAVPWGFRDKIRRYKQILLDPQRNIPIYFVNNPLIDEIFTSVYETFTEFRNQAAHASGIDVDQDDTMTITFKDGTKKQIKSREMEAALVFTTSLVNCLSNSDNRLRSETANRKAYVSAKALSNFHTINLPSLLPTWWSQVYYSFDKTPEEVQELQSIQVDLDTIKNYVLQQDAPTNDESVQIEILINLQRFSDQPDYRIPLDVAQKGGIISIARKDLLLFNNTDVIRKKD